MQIRVPRTIKTGKSTIGEMFVDGVFQCFTLEDTERKFGVKVYGETAIPLGTYPVTLEFSPKFCRRVPHIQNVPGFSSILIHPGNTDADTEGCVLVGKTHAPDFIGQSRIAFEELFRKLDGATDITITIVDA